MQNKQSNDQPTQKTSSDASVNKYPDIKKTNRKNDLEDPVADQEKLKPETVTIDLPEVKDIPGQENVTVPDIREMQDVTVSSADEEADELLSVLDSENENEDVSGGADVTEEERKLLRRAAGHSSTAENRDLAGINLDNTDADGDELSEKSSGTDRFGEDLDVPGSEADDDSEDVGAEDEENNQYSRPD